MRVRARRVLSNFMNKQLLYIVGIGVVVAVLAIYFFGGPVVDYIVKTCCPN